MTRSVLDRAPLRLDPMRLTARAAELAGVLVLAWIAAQAFWFVIYGPALQRLDIAPGSLSGASTLSSGADIRTGTARGLFSTPDSGAGPVTVEAPPTRLNLNLRGVRRGADASTGSAVIETPGSGQRSIGVGGEIAPGVTLDSVYEDRVIINRNGARESLFLTEAAARRAQERSTTSAGSAPANAAQGPSVAPQATASADSGEPDLALAADLDRDDWMDGLRLEPALEGGEMIGLRVRANTDPVILQASGLRPGDILLSLNGQALTSADSGVRAVRELEMASRLELSVRRDGAPLRLSAPLNN